MHIFRTARWLLLALLLPLASASAFAGVFISVGFAPPPLPVYDQPPCPQPGLMWTPGYWAYGEDGYYWVPGAWVPAPYDGALWTPGYWGWSGGLYVYHDGYWGEHVGYYGGVNYGFGYGGIGFAGGEWRGHEFAYNTAVMHVDRRFIHVTFEDRGRVDRGFVARDSHVAFSGGPGGIRHDAGPGERMADRDQHIAKTSFQAQHEGAARSDRNSFARNNGGRPAQLVANKPLGAESHGNPGAMNNNRSNMQQNVSRPGTQPNSMQQRQTSNPQSHQTQPRQSFGSQSNPQQQRQTPSPQSNQTQPRQAPAMQQQHQAPAQQQQRQAPAAQQQHQAPAAHSAPDSRGEREHK